MAALHPAESDYLYFVSDGNGGLRFAKTLDAHNRNVRLFRRYRSSSREGQGQMTKNASLALGEDTCFGGRRGLMLVLSSPSGAGKRQYLGAYWQGK